MSEDILAMIDGALADYTSDDAMRWSPEPEKADAPVTPDWARFWQLLDQAMAEMAPPNPAPDWAVSDGSQPDEPRSPLAVTPHNAAATFAPATWQSPYRMQPAMFYTASGPVPEWPRIDISFEVNVRPFVEAAEATMKQLRAVFLPFVRSAFERPARRPERLRRMHTAYARRARARRRRR